MRLEYCGNNIDLTQAQETLKNLGMFGAVWAVVFSEKQDQKKQKKKEKRKNQKKNNK